MEQKEIDKDFVELIKQDCENNFAMFCRMFLPEQFNLTPAKFHYDIFGVCEDKSVRRAVIVAPRFHAKSTIMSFAFPLWIICYAKYQSVLLISATGDFAEDWLRKIKLEIETNELLIAAFGDLRTDKWAANNLVSATKVQVQARGRGQQIMGRHFNVVICDDLEDEELVRSDVQLQYFKDWFDQTLYNTIDYESRMFYIGTIISTNCFLLDLIKDGNRKKIWKSWFYQAYINGVEAEGHELWAAKHSHKSLQESKLHNPYVFARAQMNDPMLDGQQKFKEEWLQYYDGVPENLRVTVTIDPSGLSKSVRADNCGIAICGTSPSGDIYVLEAISKKFDPHSLVEELFRIKSQWAPYKMGIEVVSFQKILKYYIDEKCRTLQIYLPIVELKTDTRMSKEMRILGLVPLFAEGKVWLKRGQQVLIDQIRMFPNGQHDDVLDALAYQTQIILKPFAGGKMTPEELQQRLNEYRLKQIFSSDNTPVAGKSSTGYIGSYNLGDR